MSTLEKVIEEVKALKPEELQRVRELVDSLLSEPAKPQMTEDEFERYLAAKGIISLPEPSSREAAEAEFEEYKPITVEGQPLSEMIIEDRR
jgi:hypothetical protein